MRAAPLIVLQLTKIPNGEEYLAQIMLSPRGTSDNERFALTDTHEVLRLDEQTAQTLAQLKIAIDSGGIGPGSMERLGEFLYNLIFTGVVERKLRDVIIQEKERPYRLCILIHPSAPFLETVPWEYLKRPDGFVALGLASVSRVLENSPGLPFDPLEVASMLLVYANPPGYGGSKKHADVEAASTKFIDKFLELAKTRYNLRIKTLLREEASRENFLTLLSEEQFDIVHFIGHGEVLKGDGNIVMHDDQRIPGEEIHNNLSNNPPRLFYFNSCSTAKANDRDPFSSVAQALIRTDLNPVPAVIAMQYEINVDDSFVVAEEFYERLLSPESRTFGNLERSMDYARRKLRMKKPSWGIPVLFLQTHERVMLFGEPEATPPPAQLATQLTSSIPPAVDLVNRVAEVESVLNLLASNHRLMMVTGIPGVGRGAVVRAGLDHYLQDKREEIPIWLNLEGLKPEDATLATLYLSLDRILDAGLAPLWYDARRPLAEKLSELEAKIPNTAILVLENIDVLLDAEHRFNDETFELFFRQFGTTTRRIFIIVTSSVQPKVREDAAGWNDLWQKVQVDRLSSDESVLLLQEEKLDFTNEELHLLAETVSGHPQALKILAAGIKQGALDPTKLIASRRDAKGVAEAFADAMLVSLTDAETKALKLWSVFRNPVVREAFTQGLPDADAIVDSLVTKGLLQVKDGYYSLPAIVRRVTYDELQRDAELVAMGHLLAASFFWRTDPATETEHINNVLEARYHFRQHGSLDSKRAAQGIGEELFQPLVDQGRYRELKVLIEESEADFSNYFKVEFFRAHLQGVFGEFQNALNILDLLYMQLPDNSFERASVANEIGVVLKERSDPRDADRMLEEFERAYDIFANVIRTSDDQDLIKQAHHGQAICTYNRGLVYQYFRRGKTPAEFNAAFSQAETYFRAALDIFRTLEEPDEQGIAMTLSQLGELLADSRFEGNNQRRAEKYLCLALRISERIDKPRVEIDANYQLARFLRRRGDSAQARVLFRQAADIAERIGLQNERAIAEVQIAELDFKNKQYDRNLLDAALSRNEETLGYYEDFHSIRVQSDAYFLHGLLHLAQRNQDRASESFENSRSVVVPVAAIAQSYADAKRIARGTFFLAQLALDREEPDAARKLVLEMNDHFEKIGYKLGEDEPIADFFNRVDEWRR